MIRRSPFASLFSLLLLVSLGITTDAQTLWRNGRALPKDVFCEAHLLPAEKGMCSVLVLARTYPNLLSFTREATDGPYRATYALTIECLDSSGVIRCSHTKADSAVVPTLALTRSDKPGIVSGAVCPVPPSAYKIRVILEQHGITLHRWTSAELRLTTSTRRSVLTPPILCTASGPSGIVPSVTAGPIIFSDRPVMLTSLVSGVADDEVWTWSCTRIGQADPMTASDVYSLSGRCSLRVENSVDFSRITRIADSLQVGVGPDASHLAVAAIRAEIPFVMFTPGRYRYVLRCESTGDSLVTEIPCIWPSKPQSLRSESQMLWVMRYLVTDDDFAKMSEGSESENWKNVFAWWKRHDPRPETPFNQALNDCFLRADEAAVTYQSAIEPNGIKTERGRVYILYGPPDTIRSQRASADGQRETGAYTSRLQRTVVFDIDDRGVYRIRSVEPR
ncbi:MAG: GWxTD domain-containing protein [Candidatus Kapaibacterium sp.]